MRRLLAATAALALLPLAAPAQGRTDDEIKALVLEAILQNPEVVMQAVAILQQREAEAAEAAATAALEGSRTALESGENAPVLGNPEGDVTVVEFFDYNCPYCRQAGDEVKALLAADPNVRLVYREWPILGEGSVEAARVALAARAQDGYPALHEALMGASGRVDGRAALEIAEELGLDMDRLRADMEAPEVQAHIDETMALAQGLGFNGTPSFVIGDQVAPGMVSSEGLAEMVAAARGEAPAAEGDDG
ncbi:DsbA family protein [Jannaschia sp. W003]|uniref:DsbA family protein n=1 Tax=Jannaschia sp. W003 TaxID=2867012 RepID=UPI0021A96314|nr:DsbA family protein [Jannaschia sp. W003]UWQ20051.1 DsbA family protein [Jannaschia sp. W003]